MKTTLTKRERDTLNEALAILERCTAQGSSWQMWLHRFETYPFGFDITYFDSNPGAARGQHSHVRGETLADKVQTILGIEAMASERAEVQRKARLEFLRKELAELESQP